MPQLTLRTGAPIILLQWKEICSAVNVLEAAERRDRSLVVSAIISTLTNLYPRNWGRALSTFSSMLSTPSLSSADPVTLAALPKLFTDDSYRKRLLSNVSDPAILAFFDF